MIIDLDDVLVVFFDIEFFQDGYIFVILCRYVISVFDDDGEFGCISLMVMKVVCCFVDFLGVFGVNVVLNVGEVVGQSVYYLYVYVIFWYDCELGINVIWLVMFCCFIEEVVVMVIGELNCKQFIM